LREQIENVIYGLPASDSCSGCNKPFLCDIVDAILPVVTTHAEQEVAEFAEEVKIKSITELKPIKWVGENVSPFSHAWHTANQVSFDLIDQFDNRVDSLLAARKQGKGEKS
jgi:hypothetical protein